MALVKASEFKAKCLQMMDEVAAGGESITVTKNGVPVAQLVPYRERAETMIGFCANTMRSQDDLIEPAGVQWEALTE